jgi:hypothetical protein
MELVREERREAIGHDGGQRWKRRLVRGEETPTVAEGHPNVPGRRRRLGRSGATGDEQQKR